MKSVVPVTGMIGMIALLLAAGEPASGASLTKADFAFQNVADSTSRGFILFGSMPAINNGGAVAFEAVGTDFAQGAVFRCHNGACTTIASSADRVLSGFGVAVVINSEGVVGFSSKVTNGNDTVIATGEGGRINTIASANQQGLVGGPFFGISAINSSGTVVFVAFRRGLRSQAIFAGRGGPLTALVDTATNSNFSGFGNSAIDASGRIVFQAFLPDGTDGIFRLSGDRGVTNIVDTNNPNFTGFLDPVINNEGTAASAAFLASGGVEVFTAGGRGITARNNPSNPFFTNVDNVSINNSGDVAFFASEATGGEGIFLEATGGDSPVPVIEVGDSLFGSTVTHVDLGRFSLNDSDRIAFQYVLADGRSGIAIAFPRHERDR